LSNRLQGAPNVGLRQLGSQQHPALPSDGLNDRDRPSSVVQAGRVSGDESIRKDGDAVKFRFDV